MKILITGVAGFVGLSIARYCKAHYQDAEIIGIDNLSRRGSEYNLLLLKELGCRFFHGDVRNREDVEELPKVDWIIDCAANPSVLAGAEGGSLGLINNNLTGTIYLLEKCRKDDAGFIMLSTSRVYSIVELNKIPLHEKGDTFVIKSDGVYPYGCSAAGIAEGFSMAAPVSLYGATKLASEVLALEYHYTFGFPVWINRCGVIAGPGQFGKIDQGIFSYWIYQYMLNKPLSYIGFGGSGKQARDLVHPVDVFNIMHKQMQQPEKMADKILNIGGGIHNTLSLMQLDNFCKAHISNEKVVNKVDENRRFDIPLYVSDYALAASQWDWQPTVKAEDVLHQILDYAQNNLQLIQKL